jgi:hypothetical protein
VLRAFTPALEMEYAVRALWELKVWMIAPNVSLAQLDTNATTQVWGSNSALRDTTHWKETTLHALLVPRDPTALPFLTLLSLVHRGAILDIEPPTAQLAPQVSSVWTQPRVLLLVPQGATASEELLAAPLVQAGATALKQTPVPYLAPQDTTRAMVPHPVLNAKQEIIASIRDHPSSVLSELIPFLDLKPVKFVQKDPFALALL